MENPVIPWRIQMEWFIPVEIFRKKSNPFRGITYTFFVFTETTEIICTICLVNQCQASFKGGRWFVLTQLHSLSGILQIIQL